MSDVTLQVGDGERLLEDIRSISTTGQCTHGSQVARVTTLRLYHEHPRLGAGRRLLYTTADLNSHMLNRSDLTHTKHLTDTQFICLLADRILLLHCIHNKVSLPKHIAITS